MNTKHTPGKRTVMTHSGLYYVIINGNRSEPLTYFDNVADAVLDAAAPDLLAALGTFRPVDLDNFAAWLEAFQVSMNQARAAIAKATQSP